MSEHNQIKINSMNLDKENEYNIEKWDVINLCNEVKKTCECGKNASYTFTFDSLKRIIDRKTTITAKVDIDFEDSKEGLFGLRVNRALELYDSTPQKLVSENGKFFFSLLSRQQVLFGARSTVNMYREM